MATYDPNIPQPGDNISKSQGQILDNFTALNTIFNFDHFTWNDSVTANQGLHRKVEFPATNTVSAPTGLSSVIYTKNVSSVASPYFTSAVGDFAMWYGGTTSNGRVTATVALPGELNLPNGLQMKWGNDQYAINQPTRSVSYANAFPTATLIVIVSLFESNPINPVGADTYSTGGFNARRGLVTTATANFRWFAIGY
jgi:hypothetical protein